MAAQGRGGDGRGHLVDERGHRLPDTGALTTDLEALFPAMRDNFGPAHRSAMLTALDDEGAESLRSVIFRWGKDV